MSAACLLQLPTVVDACCVFFRKLLHPSNCIGIRLFADAQSCVQLRDYARQYTEDNFQEVIRNQEFLLLPPRELETVLASDDLNVPSEEIIFQAVFRIHLSEVWIRIRILLSSCKNSKINLDSFYFLTLY